MVSSSVRLEGEDIVRTETVEDGDAALPDGKGVVEARGELGDGTGGLLADTSADGECVSLGTNMGQFLDE